MSSSFCGWLWCGAALYKVANPNANLPEPPSIIEVWWLTYYKLKFLLNIFYQGVTIEVELKELDRNDQSSHSRASGVI